MKLGIFGGTFNPPHKTHVQITQEAQKQLHLDKLLVIPCGIPPHKFCEVDSATRFHLAELAFPFAEVSDIEIVKEGKSYTVETLRHLHAAYPDAELYLIIGGDSFRDFHTWFHPEEIARLATLAVAERSRKNYQATARKNQRLFNVNSVCLNVPPTNISSTEIRLRYNFGLDNSHLVPTDVNNYVLSQKLYSNYLPMAQKVSGYLTDQRFNHTFYVVKRGLELATPQERDKVFVACLLHDCAKYISPTDYKNYGFTPPANMPSPVVHSFLGAYVAQKDFGITDPEILDAITYHTTGCPNMTRLQKIVYVADKTEDTRPYPLSHLKKGTLDHQLKLCLAEANAYTLNTHGDTMYPLTQQTLNFYNVTPLKIIKKQ